MAHEFDPGYRGRFATLCRHHPGPEVYPPDDFGVEWGPVFHRGRLDGSARILVIGQYPGTHECIVRRVLIGEAGRRVQGFLAKLGVDRRYVMVNAFLYGAFGPDVAHRHAENPAIVMYRNQWFEAIFATSHIQTVVAFGHLADQAWSSWRATPKGSRLRVVYAAVPHPSFEATAEAPDGVTATAERTAKMLVDYNSALERLVAAVRPEIPVEALEMYGSSFHESDMVPVPEGDLPPGTPEWMRSVDTWAVRATAGEAEGPAATPEQVAAAKRATVVVRVPRHLRPWHVNR